MAGGRQEPLRAIDTHGALEKVRHAGATGLERGHTQRSASISTSSKSSLPANFR